MPILLFFVVLLVLVIAHEFGHFAVAKLAGMKVEEFGFGFPPRLGAVRKGETEYSFNLLPFGGFVKIFGENQADIAEKCLTGEIKESDFRRSFVAQNRWKQAAVVLAGVFFNFLLAWLLLSAGFMIGLPVAVENDPAIEDTALIVTSVLPDSPAALAGLKTGDTITGVTNGAVAELNERSVSNFIAASKGKEIGITIRRGDRSETVSLVPTEGVIPGKAGIGVSLALVGIQKLPLLQAIGEGFQKTVALTKATAVALGTLIRDAFIGEARLDSLTGPVGLVGIVGNAFALGLVHLIALTALISINLALINLVPFPALDGGRFLVILLEGIARKSFSPKILGALNTLGFVILIFLLVLVTYNDIIRLF